MSASAGDRFDLAGPLPTGVNVLEASAGTGKTYAIASLALRYVGDGVPLERLLIVTFTRLATGELRERVRRRLAEGLGALTAALEGGTPGTADEVLNVLAQGTSDDLRQRQQRVQRALATFDAATIATTHGFCQEVLDGLGVAGDAGRGIEVTEDLGGLVDETVADLYIRHHALPGEGAAAGVKHAEARRVAQAVVQHPDVPIVPELAGGDDPVVAARVRFAAGVRREFARRTRAQGLLGYDDLLGLLRDTLRDPSVGDACRRRLAARFDVVLVDEFQDTDPVQWDILREGFAGGTLVLIGDPKQAIYAFRGADVHTYLRARGAADRRFTLPVNWRSDQGYLAALEAVFQGAQLGHAGITTYPVQCTPRHAARRLTGTGHVAPLRLRMLRRDRPDAQLTAQGLARVDWARGAIAADLARQVATLLAGGVRVPDGDGSRPARPGDIGVLTRTNAQAVLVRTALAQAGVPSVIAGTGSVFATQAAQDWRRLLEALERPADPRRASAAALGTFIGWDARRLAECPEDERAGLHDDLHAWRRVLDERGVMALMQTLIAEGLPARVLARPGGERVLTDLHHIAQLLHQAATQEGLRVAALAGWTAGHIATADGDASDERSRRLETDRAAVQVLTVHRSKGLEFGIVCLPYLWDVPGAARRGDAVPVVDDPDDGRRVMDVGGTGGPAFARRFAQEASEQRGEELRLAYVGLTRARHQALVWWAAAGGSRHSPLARLLVQRSPDGAIPSEGPALLADDDMRAVLDALAAAAPRRIAVEDVDDEPAPAAPPPAATDGADLLTTARFDRAVDRAWGRYSYSRITQGTYEALVASEPETARAGDEPDVDVGTVDDPLPMRGLPAGTAFGSLVHGVLEAADFTAPDLEDELGRAIARQPGGSAPDDGALAGALAAALRTPLGAALADLRLADVPAGDRLNELGFELPLAGGERPAGYLDAGDLAALLDEHLTADDPLAGYPAALRAVGPDAPLRGFMVGSLDLVVRLPGPRFAVIDHKTNLLGTAGVPTMRDYHPDALAGEMQRHHYVLQALIYQVALHRYLRWRLSGYDPRRHLAGAHYLFLRGLAGPDTPATGDGRRHGVFSWTPPAALVVAASDLFQHGRTA